MFRGDWARPLAILFAALVWLNGAWAQGLQAVPPMSSHVIDLTATLEPDQARNLETKLTVLEKDTGSQVVVLMVPTVSPEDIAAYSNRVGNSWKIGRKGIGDGLLLLVAKGDRQVRIEVAKALEGAIPDLAASRIIEEAITPRFRQGDFAGGLEAGIDRIAALIKGEALSPPQSAKASAQPGGFNLSNLVFFMFVAVPVIGSIARSIFGRGPGSVLTGTGVGILAFVVTSSIWVAALAALAALFLALFSGLSGNFIGGGRGFPGGGGFRSGGISGGGFSSGGGGNFGGGGASGRW